MSLLKCAVPWPACPRCYVGEVVSSARKDRCRGCHHEWPSLPPGAPCGQPATHLIGDATGSGLVCDAHAGMAHKLLPDARIEKLTIVRREIVL